MSAETTPSPLWRNEWFADELVGCAQPIFFHDNKKFLYEMAYSKVPYSTGTLCCSRWNTRGLPDEFPASHRHLQISGKPGYFDYEPQGDDSTIEWHLNFASSEAFSTWPSSLFAQDEMQVAEHPALMSLSITAKRMKLSMLCTEDGQPTPVLVAGVERRIEIDTAPAPSAGRPYGLYGVHFKRATEPMLAEATTVFDPPRKSNLIAIEAPAYGSGTYTEDDILNVLVTAYSGFSAARDESQVLQGYDNVCIHTGFWGCGAYGGNRVVMTLLQCMAAELAGVKQIMFHIGDASGVAPYANAIDAYRFLRNNATLSVAEVVARVVACCYAWGESDGN